jgi:single-strand DNA-binding protein
MKVETQGFVNLTRDPKDVGKSSAVVIFGIAENHSKKNKRDEWENDGTTFYDCVAFGDVAEDILDAELSKGDSIKLTGRLRSETYEDKNGDERTIMKITIETFEKIERKKGGRKKDEDTGRRRPSSRGKTRNEDDDDDEEEEEKPARSRSRSATPSRGRSGRAPWRD